jgi:hypothetical protein
MHYGAGRMLITVRVAVLHPRCYSDGAFSRQSMIKVLVSELAGVLVIIHLCCRQPARKMYSLLWESEST